MPSSSETRYMICSVTNMPWGPPKPRSAVLDRVLVRQTLPVMLTVGK
jgi:hypothetical protein